MKPVFRVLVLVGILSISPWARAEPQTPPSAGISLSELASDWWSWLLDTVSPTSSSTSPEPEPEPEPPPPPPPQTPEPDSDPGYGGIIVPGG